MSKLPSLFNLKLTKTNPLGYESADTLGLKKPKSPKPPQVPSPPPPSQFPELLLCKLGWGKLLEKVVSDSGF